MNFEFEFLIEKPLNENSNASFYILVYSAARQTEPRLAIRLSHPVLLHHDMQLWLFFYDLFVGQRMIYKNDYSKTTSARTERERL